MAVSAREQRILILAGLVGAVFVVAQIVPAVQGLYQRRNAEIETVLLAVERGGVCAFVTMQYNERPCTVAGRLEPSLADRLRCASAGWSRPFRACPA